MGVADDVERELPYLRRYARAVTGSRATGDDIIESLVHDLIETRPETNGRVPLFRLLDGKIAARAETDSTIKAALSTEARRALLLSAMEGFALDQVGEILRVDDDAAADLVADAETALTAELASDVFVIEDEPLVAAHIAQIATQMGHRVIGDAATRDAAVEACLARPPDLLLADIQLADGSSGIDAAEAITEALNIPVIFITAYPQKLLKGKGSEPAFLIAKPFRPDMVKAVISQALIQKSVEIKD